MIFTDGKVLVLGAVIFLIAISGSLVFGEDMEVLAEVGVKVMDWEDYDKLEGEVTLVQNYANEGEELKIPHNITDLNICSISFRLTWTDEEDVGWIGPSPNHENHPDEFTLSAVGPDGSVKGSGSASNQHGMDGLLELTLTVPTPIVDSLNGTGDWDITITVNAGDHEPARIGLFKFLDNGNDFTLEIFHEYYSKH